MADEDILDKLMPNPDESQSGAEDLEIEFADGPPAETAPPDAQDAGVRLEDAGAQINDDDEPENDKRYPAQITDRIKREQRLRRREVEQERNLRRIAEEAAAKANNERIESQLITYSVLETHLKDQISGLQSKLVHAKENGQSQDEVSLQSQLNDAEANLRKATEAKIRVEEEKKAPKPAIVNVEAQSWVSRNGWFNDPEFEPEAQAVRIMDKKLVASKRFDPNSPAFFQELDRQIAERFPSALVRAKEAGLRRDYSYDDDEDAPPPRRSNGKSPVSGGSRQPSSSAQSGGTPPQSRTRVVLGKDDFENMRKFRMDPTNKSHVQQYAREKLAAQQGE